MKIALCASIVPFVRGGARNIVDWLEPVLREAGHQVERVDLPHRDEPQLLLRQMAAYRWVDLTESADRIICFRPPAHAIRHPHKILWFIHHLRSFYDLWDTPYRGFDDTPQSRGLRDALRAADTAALQEAKSVFTNSQVVSQRLRRYNGIDSTVLYPPLHVPERFHTRGFNDEVVTICRVEHHKRQHLLVEAMHHTQTPVRLRLCGVGSSPAYMDELRAAVSHRGLDGRVVLEDRWISEERKIDLLADCLAAAYLPVDEDSYGYPSLEACHSGKALLTTTDSGGVLELVEHGRSGLVSEPTPQAIGQALDQLYTDRAATERMGREARARVAELGIDWQRVLGSLLA